MSEAVEWRVARLKILVSYFFAMFITTLSWVFFAAAGGSGGVSSVVSYLYGFWFLLLAVWIALYNYGLQTGGYARRFCDRVPYLGGYHQRALDEWGDELEERDAFSGDRE